MGNPGKYNSFGRYTYLNSSEPVTKTILVSENIYLKLKEFSRRNNTETYERAINYLLDFWSNNNSEYTHLTRY